MLHRLPGHAPVVHRHGAGLRQAFMAEAAGGEHHGDVHALKHPGTLVNAAADKDKAVDALLVEQAEGSLELVVLLVDELHQERGLAVPAVEHHGLRQGGEKRIPTAAQNNGHHVAVGLLEAAGVGVAHKVAVRHHLFDLLAGFPVDIGPVVQHAGDGCHAHAGLAGDVLDRINLHQWIPSLNGRYWYRQRCR